MIRDFEMDDFGRFDEPLPDFSASGLPDELSIKGLLPGYDEWLAQREANSPDEDDVAWADMMEKRELIRRAVVDANKRALAAMRSRPVPSLVDAGALGSVRMAIGFVLLTSFRCPPAG